MTIAFIYSKANCKILLIENSNIKRLTKKNVIEIAIDVPVIVKLGQKLLNVIANVSMFLLAALIQSECTR